MKLKHGKQLIIHSDNKTYFKKTNAVVKKNAGSNARISQSKLKTGKSVKQFTQNMN